MEERGQRAARDAGQDLRDLDAMVWFNQEKPPELRLLRFDSWVRVQLNTRLDWTWAGDAKQKRIEQCRIELNNVCKHLFKRGWMFDGERLAKRITDLLDVVGKYQRAGKVLDFWSYYKSAVDRYVGANAEELREEALQAGVHVGQIFRQLSRQLPVAPSIPELVAKREEESLRAKLSRQRQMDGAGKGAADEPQLF